MSQDDRPFCQDCGIKSDLGNKCRPCYAKWSRFQWADIPRELAKLRQLAVELNQLDDRTRRSVADAARGRGGHLDLSARAQEVLRAARRGLEGPYGEQLLAKLQAISNASEVSEQKKRTKHATTEVE